MDKATLALLIFLGVYVGFYFVMFLLICYDKRNSAHPMYDPAKPGKYDERQLADQALAGKYALWAVVGYLVLWALLDGFGLTLWEPTVGALLGVVLGVGSFGAICILRDAYFKPGDKEHMAQLVPLLIINLGFFFINSNKEKVLSDGRLTGGATGPLLLLLAMVLYAALLVRYAMEKRGAGAAAKREVLNWIFALVLGLGSLWNVLCLLGVLPMRLWTLSLSAVSLTSVVMIVTRYRALLEKSREEPEAERKAAKLSPSAGLVISLGAAWIITMVACL